MLSDMRVKERTNEEFYDCMILSFKYISVSGKPSITAFQNVKNVLYKLSYFEIVLPIGTFLEIKENESFQCACSNLFRVRTTKRTFLGILCLPINRIDNQL